MYVLPLDEMIKYARLKFMHNYVRNRLLFSFNETWIFNHVRNYDNVLRNANDMYSMYPPITPQRCVFHFFRSHKPGMKKIFVNLTRP